MKFRTPLFAAVLSALALAHASASTITVTDGGDAGGASTCTLRQAIEAANAGSAGSAGVSACLAATGADTLVFASSLANSTITLAGRPLEITAPMSIIGSGQTIDGAGRSSLVHVKMALASQPLVMSQVTLTHGFNAGAPAGAMNIDYGYVLLDHVSALANSAAGNTFNSPGAGAIYSSTWTTLVLRNSVVSGNTLQRTSYSDVARSAGGVMAFDTLQIDHSLIQGNSAASTSYVTGGVMSGFEQTTIAYSTITGNTAVSSGGVASGGLYALDGSDFTLTGSLVAGNQGSTTGGVHVYGAFGGMRVDMRNSSITGNSVSGAGNIGFGAGGLAFVSQCNDNAYAQNVRLTNLTVTGNSTPLATAYQSGGMTVLFGDARDTLTIGNSIIAGNSGGRRELSVSNAGSSVVASNLLGSALAASWSGGNNRFADDPLLAPLADNGGPTLTLAPRAGSPVVDAGDDTLLGAGAGSDQRGAPFVRVAGAAIDIGALEAQVPGSERATLIALYLATNGDAWTQNTNWCAGTCPPSGTPTFAPIGSECSWYGVTCDETGAHAVALAFASNALGGTLPPLAGLPQLTAADFDGNRLVGALPDLRTLSNLRSFHAAHNRLAGGLPDLAGLTEFGELVLSDNAFTGPIPASLAAWPALQRFDVSGNDLAGPIPALAGAQWLTDFSVAHNNLTGASPRLDNVPRLAQFVASYNLLSTPLPAFGDAPSLRRFDVSSNELKGVLPPLQNLAAAEDLAFAHNALSGPVPSLVGMARLARFDAHRNALSGPPPDIAGSALVYLDLSDNALSGTLPDWSGNTTLQALYLGRNRFSGELPPAPPNLLPHHSDLCPNPLEWNEFGSDPTWDAATGQVPWWGPQGAGCDGLAGHDFEGLENSSFERGIVGWHIGSGSCLWQSRRAGAQTVRNGQWIAPEAPDGGYVLMSDSSDDESCNLYQQVQAPADAGRLTIQAALGYNTPPGVNSEGCAVSISIDHAAGTEPYVRLSGTVALPLTQYPPASFAITPGELLTVDIDVEACGTTTPGVVVDDIRVSFD